MSDILELKARVVNDASEYCDLEKEIWSKIAAAVLNKQDFLFIEYNHANKFTKKNYSFETGTMYGINQLTKFCVEKKITARTEKNYVTDGSDRWSDNILTDTGIRFEW